MVLYEQYRQTRDFASLNGIRCLGVLLVIGFHQYGNYLAHQHVDTVFQAIFNRGFLGVDLFFVLSGFLIGTLLLREYSLRATISVRDFYLRRMLRILPLYYAALALYALMLFLLRSSNEEAFAAFKGAFPFFATLSSNWFVEGYSGIFAFAWSLAAEVQFYLVWPLMFKYLPRTLTLVFIVVLIMLSEGVAFGLVTPSLLAGFPSGGFCYRVLETFCVPIGMGVLLAYALHFQRVYARLGFLGHRLASGFFLGVLVLSVWAPAELSATARLLVHVSMFLFVASCVYRQDHFLAGVLNSQWLSRMGFISYGMYLFSEIGFSLVHWIFEYGRWNSAFLEFSLTVVLVALMAGVSYQFYEKYFLKLRHRFQHVPS